MASVERYATVGDVSIEPTVLTKAQARRLTDQTRKAAEDFWRLLVRCHEEKAWVALGYSSWKGYVEAELAVSEGQAFRLLDQGKVTLALEAAGVGKDSRARESSKAKIAGQPLVSARQAAKLKADLPEAVAEIQAAVEGGEKPAEAVKAAVEARTPVVVEPTVKTKTKTKKAVEPEDTVPIERAKRRESTESSEQAIVREGTVQVERVGNAESTEHERLTNREALDAIIARGADAMADCTEAALVEGISVLRNALIVRRARGRGGKPYTRREVTPSFKGKKVKA